MARQVLWMFGTMITTVLAVTWSVVAMMGVSSVVTMSREDWGGHYGQWKMWYLISQMQSYSMMAASIATMVTMGFWWSVSMRLQSYVVEEAYFLPCLSYNNNPYVLSSGVSFVLE